MYQSIDDATADDFAPMRAAAERDEARAAAYRSDDAWNWFGPATRFIAGFFQFPMISGRLEDEELDRRLLGEIGGAPGDARHGSETVVREPR